jgi:exonuclease III
MKLFQSLTFILWIALVSAFPFPHQRKGGDRFPVHHRERLRHNGYSSIVPSSSCAGFCGSQPTGASCWCDDECATYNNCCSDACTECDICGSSDDSVSDSDCPTAPSSPSDRRTNPNTLRLIQYNVEYLFIDEFNGCPGSECPWANSAEAEEHLNTVAGVIAAMNPDIINFCEVEGCDELNDVISVIGDDTYSPYLVQGTDYYTGQNVGMLTRVDPVVDLQRTSSTKSYPIPGSNCGYTGSGSTSVSKHYYTKFEINNLKIAMIGAHLLAFPTDVDRCSEREAQALVLRDIIDENFANGYEVIMLGDFNDYDGVVLDANSDVPNSQVLSILKGTYSNSSNILYPVSDKVEQPVRYTDFYDANDNCVDDGGDEDSMIDHILLSSKLYDAITNVTFYHAYEESCDTFNSDHWPVIVDFDFSNF